MRRGSAPFVTLRRGEGARRATITRPSASRRNARNESSTNLCVLRPTLHGHSSLPLQEATTAVPACGWRSRALALQPLHAHGTASTSLMHCPHLAHALLTTCSARCSSGVIITSVILSFSTSNYEFFTSLRKGGLPWHLRTVDGQPLTRSKHTVNLLGPTTQLTRHGC